MTETRAERLRGDLHDSAYAWHRWASHLVRPIDPVGLASGHLAPIVLLPGVYETWQFLEPLARRLHALGHPIHVPPGFGLNLRSIPESAALAQRFIDEQGLRDITVVAHSKGGLIAKHMVVVDDRETHRIDRLIAINTPFAGSSHARFALRRALREFNPAATTITALDREIEANGRITSIYSRRDPVVPAGSRLAGATNIELPLVGHFRILSSSQLMTVIETVLGYPTVQ